MTRGHPPAQKRRTARLLPQAPWLEWLASALGLAVMAVLMAALAWQIATTDGGGAAVVVEAEHVTPYEAGYVVAIRVRNVSSAAAAAIEIEGTINRGRSDAETARATIDYVPGHSLRRAGLFFTRDPRDNGVELRALGYSEP